MATDCDPTAPPLTFDQMKAQVQRTKARSRVMEAWPLACPERARQFERAVLGDPAAVDVLVAGALRVLALRARQAEAGEDVDEFWRHLPGQHNQKSHGRGAISSLAVEGRVAEIIAKHGGREAARAERGSLADAALFDLAGYSGPPTVLSPDEFDAYEGQAAGPSGRSEFGRGFRTGVDAEGGQAARDMVYDEANHYAGLGIYANGTHVSSPLIASWYAGGLDAPPRHSVDDGDSGYVRVKLKPGTKVVRWEDLQTLDVPEGSGDAFAQKPDVKVIEGDFDMGIADQYVPTPPASTPATTTQRPSVEINMEAINKHGAQVIDVSGVDPTGSLIILDRSAMVVEQFVDPADAYSPEATPAAQGMRADLPVMSVADQSRALALLVNADPTVRPRVIRDGWAGLSEAEADRAVTMFDAQFRPSTRHLPGKHDQKSHGKGGDSASLPEGWKLVTSGSLAVVATSSGGSGVGISIVDNGILLSVPEGERQRFMEEAVTRTARHVAALQERYPDVKVQVELVNGASSPRLQGQAHGATDYRGATRDKGISIAIATGLYGTPHITSEGFQGWKTKSTLHAGEQPFAAALYAKTAGDFNIAAGGYDPVRYVVTHEFGHAVAATNAYAKDRTGYIVRFSETEWSSTEAARVIAPMTASEYVSMTRYARSEADEAYAEGFAAWEMRDLADPPEWATSMAERAGWAE